MVMEHWPWFLIIAIAAGLVRGLTGFGGAMVMTLPLAWLLPPGEAISVVLLMESIAAAPLLRRAYADCSGKTLVPICVFAAVFLPFGVMAQSRMDPDTVRTGIALLVLVFSVLLMFGVGIRNAPPRWVSGVVGSVGGFLMGSTAIGGPIVVLYLMALKDSPEVARANLMIYITFVASFGLLILILNGAVGRSGLYLMLLMTPIYLVGGFSGERLARSLPVNALRRFTLSFLALSGMVSLFL